MKRTSPSGRPARGSPPADSPPALSDAFLLEALLDHAEDIIYFKDRDSRFLRVSRAFADHVGRGNPARLIGLTDRDLFTTEHAEEAARDEAEILRTGNPLIGKVEKETWSDGRITWVSTTKLPLRGPDGTIIGTFGISRDVTRQHLAEQKLKHVARELKRRNVEYEQDLELAGEIFSVFAAQLPARFPEPAAGQVHLACAARYQPAAGKLGGDFFLTRPRGDRLRIMVCDVMGHGMQSALVAVLVRAWAQDLITECPTPADWLKRLNRRLVALFLDTDNCFTATAFAADLDPATGRMVFSSAGHPYPLLRRGASGRVIPLTTPRSQGPGLGMLPDASFANATRTLAEEDLLVIYTDGLTEAPNAQRDEFDTTGALQSLRRSAGQPPEPTLLALLHDLAAHTGDLPPQDDICLLALHRTRGLPPHA